VQRGIAWWESRGYRVRLMPGALDQDGWHAGSPEVRAADLQAAFADPEIDAIQTMRGGYGSAQLIPLLDFDAIRRHRRRSSASPTSQRCMRRFSFAPVWRRSTGRA
jgi:muramoyltetrapeptide carboxypeptidase